MPPQQTLDLVPVDDEKLDLEPIDSEPLNLEPIEQPKPIGLPPDKRTRLNQGFKTADEKIAFFNSLSPEELELVNKESADKAFNVPNILSSFFLQDPGYTSSGGGVFSDFLDQNIAKIPGIQAVANEFAKKVPGSNLVSNIVKGGIQTFGDVLADPRTYITPPLMRISGFGSKYTPSGRDVYESRFANARNVTPSKVSPTNQLEGSIDYDGQTALQSITPRIPPNTGTTRRFLSSGTVTSEMRGGATGKTELIPPIESNVKTSRFSKAPINESLPPVTTPRELKSRFTKTAEGDLVANETGEVIPYFPDEGIQLARTPTGGLTISMDVRRGAEQLKKDYSGSLPGIMVREAVQNAIDAVKMSGAKTGDVRVDILDEGGKNILQIKDTGKGLTSEELGTVFTDLYSSGKSKDPNASGGKGIGKATYLLGGHSVEINTVSIDPTDGKKYQLTLNTTPEDLLDPTRAPKETKIEVPENTPTGTTIRTTLSPDQSAYDAREMADKIKRYSRGLPGTFTSKRYSFDKDKPLDWSVDQGDEILGSKNFGHSEVTAMIPKDAQRELASGFEVHVLNNGLYQFSDWHGLKDKSYGIPSEVIIDIRPKVDEQNMTYPFPAQRESVKDAFRQQLKQFIDDNLDNVEKGARAKVQEMYDNLQALNVNTANRAPLFFDPGDRLTLSERNYVTNSPVVKNLASLFDDFLETITIRLHDDEVYNRLEGVGILFGPQGVHGLHIPNPSSHRTKQPRSSILINPFATTDLIRMKGPEELGLDLMTTVLHEAAHIRMSSGSTGMPKLAPTDVSDPDVGTFLQTYLNEIATQGGLNTGHGMEFIQRLGVIYARAGSKDSIQVARAITDSISDKLPDGTRVYNAEFQELLRIYNERLGRDATTEDYLSGTGVKQETPVGGRGGTKGNAQSSSAGTPPPRRPIVDRIPQRRPESITPEELQVRLAVEQDGTIDRALKLFHGLKATGDLGPIFRQGAFYAGRPFWRKAVKQQFISYASEGGHQRFLADIALDRSMKPEMKYAGFKDGKPVTRMADRVPRSRVEAAGLHLDLTSVSNPNKMEEQAIGLDDVEKVFKYLGGGVINPARATSRAYQATIINLRLGAFNVLSENYGRLYESLKKTARTPKELQEAEVFNPDNPILYTKIADEVNQTSGRSKLGIKERSLFGRKMIKGRNWESKADDINLMAFSARYAKSRIDQAAKMVGFFGQDPVMRREYLKQLLSYGALTVGLTTLSALFGAKVEWNPRSGQFGKARFTNRINMDVTSGMGKNAVLAAQTILGETKNRRGEVKDLTAGNPVTGDVMDKIENWLENQTSPPVSFAMDVANRRRRFGGRNSRIDLTSPTDVGGLAMRDLATPISWENLYEIMQEDPTYTPLIFLDALGASVNIYER